ncbi:MAG: UDP-N-acetylglucosamine--N-acetylmuramyl-(pentapeptide) pyrophosphoryl-undecaprenol N-acetylglucosamine transferase, partial [Ruminococcus sp.]|nr:UDP-N-acetylglucosamine--N-acetylmuramyl-(pentapeptide) pyrophosphoryl-undecaprenol N-acetylglucosamine transferase [Ruminococcus sp.]
NAKALAYLAASGKRAKEIISGFKPDIAIGTGGYAAGPVIRKAAKMGIPTAIHEQNAYPGITNKLLSKEVDHVMLTVKEALDFMDKGSFEYSITGLPVRSSISGISKAEARKKLGFNNDFTILSFGGSLGAGCINETMAEAIKWHTQKGLKINHIHGYGGMGKDTFPQAMSENSIPLKSSRLRITEYINDMEVCLAAADLVICRSGASTLAELEAAGRASILIPSPIVAGNHQYHNAMVLGKAGAAEVIEQKDASPERLIAEIELLYNNPDKVRKMSESAGSLFLKDTNQRILAVIDSLIKKK